MRSISYAATRPIVIVPRPKSMSRTARNVALWLLLRTGGSESTSAFMTSSRRGPGTSMITMPLRWTVKPPSTVPRSIPGGEGVGARRQLPAARVHDAARPAELRLQPRECRDRDVRGLVAGVVHPDAAHEPVDAEPGVAEQDRHGEVDLGADQDARDAVRGALDRQDGGRPDVDRHDREVERALEAERGELDRAGAVDRARDVERARRAS